jgi:8-oxo-dGTP pyrophosphatase MutT (NUDIX family)
MPSGVIDVAAGLVERDGLILITQRKEGSHLAGLWEFPGGKREAAETWQDCLVRELHEELAITVTVGELRYETVHHFRGAPACRLCGHGLGWPEGSAHLRISRGRSGVGGLAGSLKGFRFFEPFQGVFKRGVSDRLLENQSRTILSPCRRN